MTELSGVSPGPITPQSGGGTGAAGQSAQTGGGAAENLSAASDFEVFLQLLTSQMRNQNPLKPLDSTEFVAQLASFSTVEQQVATNDKLDALIGMQSGADPFVYVGAIGSEVAVNTGDVAFDGEAVSFTLPAGLNGDARTARVLDASGAPVATLALPAGTSQAAWDGRTAEGALAAPGRYRIEIIGPDGAGGSRVDAPITSGVVSGVRVDGEGVMLELANGIAVPSAAVLSIRQVKS